jgi:hypothetical protein
VPEEIGRRTRYLIAAADLTIAARLAADASLHLSEWTWVEAPGGATVFERTPAEAMRTDPNVGYYRSPEP